MKTLVTLISVLALSLPALAASNACIDAAAQKKLAGAAQKAFIHKCERDKCEAAATQKKLAGAARSSYMQKCMHEGMQPYCDAQATGKKLRGAARNSFMNRCQTE
jgi:uncharacterized protein YdbL (DUF1318 family)